MEDGGGMVNRYAAEHIIINGKDNIEPWINRYFVPEEEYHQLEAENARLKQREARLREALTKLKIHLGTRRDSAHMYALYNTVSQALEEAGT
jgi:hypothetical protein